MPDPNRLENARPYGGIAATDRRRARRDDQMRIIGNFAVVESRPRLRHRRSAYEHCQQRNRRPVGSHRLPLGMSGGAGAPPYWPLLEDR